ncbi:hypothetical protein EUZ93_01575 [Wolbachia pipientis]|nr:hypothetical protein [Wolbachia pipientis]
MSRKVPTNSTETSKTGKLTIRKAETFKGRYRIARLLLKNSHPPILTAIPDILQSILIISVLLMDGAIITMMGRAGVRLSELPTTIITRTWLPLMTFSAVIWVCLFKKLLISLRTLTLSLPFQSSLIYLKNSFSGFARYIMFYLPWAFAPRMPIT